MSGETPPALGEDWPAIAAHAAHHDIATPAEALASWLALGEDRRVAWRASADAVRMLLDAERDNLKARLEDGGAEHPSCDVHRWWAVVKHYGSFAYGFATSGDGLRVWDDADEFEHAKARDFE